MPEFRLSLLYGCIKGLILLHLNYESNFSRIAEIGDCEATDFLDKGLTGELELVLPLFDQVLDLVGLQLHDAANAELWCPLALVQIAKNILHVCVLLSSDSTLALTRQVNEELFIFVIWLNLIIDSIQGEHARVTILLGLIPTPLSIQLTGAAGDPLLLRNHALFQLIEDWEEFSGSLFDIWHRWFELVCRVEAAQVVRWLATRNGTHVIALIIDDIHWLIGSVCLLLRKEWTKAAIALATTWSVPDQTIIRAEALCIIILRLVICTGSEVIYWVEIANVTGHTNIFPANVE